MTKHIAGLILFSFIVGTSVFVAALTSAERSAVDVKVNYKAFKKKKKRKRKRRRCRPHHRNIEASLEKAVFSKESGLLTASFAIPGESRSDGIVKLHFFAKDRYGARFLKTETLGYVDRSLEHSEQMEWLSRIDEGQNIYVMASIDRYPRSWTMSPRFDAGKAVPLLVSED